jgi:hypothetical protein
MAKPPEPLAEMLPTATLVVEAVVAQVLSTGPRPLQPEADAKPKDHTDRGILSAPQTLTLEVMRVLKGKHAGKTITVEKPAAPYSLMPGASGAFLLDEKNVILGRYGPDSWHITRVEAALKERSP